MSDKITRAVLALLFAGLLLPSAAAAEDALQMPDEDAVGVVGAPVRPPRAECAAQNLPSGGSCAAAGFCGDIESCKRFCCCACDREAFTGEWWKDTAVYNDKTTCEHAPQSGPGMIAPDSRDLLDLGTELRGLAHLVGARGKKAAREVADGLRALDAEIAGAADKPGGQDVRVKIHNCYRRAIGNPTAPRSTDGNAEAVCQLVFKLLKVENSTIMPEATKADWRANAANVWRMSWPGPTPHAGGVACDIVLVDAAGAECFDVAAGPASKKKCSIDGKVASSFLDKAVSRTGGWRLDYEAWHYEWGGGHKCRCQHPACGDESWPPTGTARCVGD